MVAALAQSTSFKTQCGEFTLILLLHLFLDVDDLTPCLYTTECLSL